MDRVTFVGSAIIQDKMPSPYFIAIGASGSEGLQDIVVLLRMLPQPLPAVVMVVLHRPTDKISALRAVLARQCEMPIVISTEGQTFTPGTCYIGEPQEHLTLVAQNLAHLVASNGNSLRNRTIDTLFKSLATHAGPRVIGVVLSGSLDDGSRGLAAIHQAKGLTMVLEPGSKPRGMQQNAIDYDGPISFIGTTDRIADVIGQVLADDPGRSA